MLCRYYRKKPIIICLIWYYLVQNVEAATTINLHFRLMSTSAILLIFCGNLALELWDVFKKNRTSLSFGLDVIETFFCNEFEGYFKHWRQLISRGFLYESRNNLSFTDCCLHDPKPKKRIFNTYSFILLINDFIWEKKYKWLTPWCCVVSIELKKSDFISQWIEAFLNFWAIFGYYR